MSFLSVCPRFIHTLKRELVPALSTKFKAEFHKHAAERSSLIQGFLIVRGNLKCHGGIGICKVPDVSSFQLRHSCRWCSSLYEKNPVSVSQCVF